jgi:DNA processing protein
VTSSDPPDAPCLAPPPPPPPDELTPLHSTYPSRLRALEKPPASLFTRGGSLEAERVVAIVGSREPTSEAKGFATHLASKLARQGVVVASGGALGIDGASHRGALDAHGRTWVVAPTGPDRVFPPAHADLFAEVAQGPGAVVWTFPPGHAQQSYSFLIRNHLLVALADAVVVIQAGAMSGALHAAGCARKLGRPLWVCPAPPWQKAFLGSRQLLAAPASRARPLHFEEALFESLGLPCGPPPEPPADLALFPSEAAALRAISGSPLHLDAIASTAGLPAATAAVALLTLALENVVVEGPPGFFRRRDGR